MRPLVAVFDRLPCEAGALSFPHLQYTALSVELARGAASTLTITAPLDAVTASSVRTGRILMLTSPRLPGGRLECVVATVQRRNSQPSATVATLPLRYLLKRRGYVRELRPGLAPRYAFNEGDLPVRRVLERFILQNAALDGLPWLLGIRRIEYPGTINIGAFDRVDRDEICERIERETQQFIFLTREDRADGTPIGYWLELLQDPAAVEPVLPGYVQGDVVDVEETDSLPETITSVLGIADNGQLMGETAWRVVRSDTASPAWVQLRDPSGGDPPVAEDGQFVGAFVRLIDGAQLAILASLGEDSSVQLARPVPVGALVGLVADAAGAPITEISSPAGLADRGLLQAQATVARARVERNYLNNADLAQGRTGWTHGGSPPRGRLVARSRLDTPRFTGALRVATGAAATTAALKALPAGQLHRGDALRFDAWDAVTGAGTGNAAGQVTLSVAPPVPAGGIADDTSLPLVLANGIQYNTQALGAQAGGASTITVDGLPVIPDLVIGQTLIVAEGATQEWVLTSGFGGSGAVTFTCLPVNDAIAAGTAITVTEVWEYYDDPTGFGVEFIRRVTTFSSTGTLISSYAPGDQAVAIDFGGTRAPPISSLFAPDAAFLAGSFGRDTSVARTYTLTSSPAWDGTGEATVGISPSIVQALPVRTQAVWSGGGGLALELPLGAAASVATVRVRLLAANSIPAGTRVRLAGQDTFVAETVAVPPSGEADVALIVALPNAMPVDRAVRVVRIPDLASDEPGSDTTLQFDAYGLLTTPTLAVAQSVRFQVVPGTPITLRARVGVSVWGIRQPGRQFSFTLTGIGPTVTLGGILAEEGEELRTQHHTLNATESLAVTATRQLSVGFANVNAVNYLDARMRYAMLTVSADPNVPFILDSGSNRLHQRCNNVLQARRDPSRFVLKGRALDALLDRLGTDRVHVGQRIRVRDPLLGRDVERRIQRYTISWATQSDGASLINTTLEAGTLDPRLSRVTVSL